jgi:hypothetical protein
VLVVTAVGAILFAITLFTSRSVNGGPFASWSAGQRGAGLALVLLIMLALLGVLLHRSSRPLWLAAEAGGVLVAPAVVEDPVHDALAAHPDVVRVKASVSGRRGRLRATVSVAVRPYAEAAVLRDELAGAARAVLERVAGEAVADVSLKVRVLAVRQLARYL